MEGALTCFGLQSLSYSAYYAPKGVVLINLGGVVDETGAIIVGCFGAFGPCCGWLFVHSQSHTS